MSGPRSRSGQQLWRLLPQVYRSRDTDSSGGDGDLAAYLDAFGRVLDEVRATLDQRLADCLPDDPDDDAGNASQEWLLPYFARLVAERPVSPHPEGRRREVTEAIALRQAKGTRRGVEQIAEAVSGKLEPGSDEGRSGVEVEIREGWTLTAVTPRVSTPLLPHALFGVTDPMPGRTPPPTVAARHPALPLATVDTRRVSRAVRVRGGTPYAHSSTFGGRVPVSWRINDPQGVPCFPGSYDDVAPRTVDTRTPDDRHGHVHPRHVLLFVAPPVGAFKALTGPLEDLPEAVRSEDRDHSVTRKTFARLTVTAGSVRLRECAIGELVVDVDGADAGDVLIEATDCLFGSVRSNGRVRLEYCTVLEDADFQALDASDSIFAGTLAVTGTPSCIRYSRVPEGFTPPAAAALHATTTAEPQFLDLPRCVDGDARPGTGAFGEPGCGVLHPAAPRALRTGAEDGGEMGASHRLAFTLETEAVLAKVAEHLPLNVRPVLVVDPRLLQRPPRIRGAR